MIRLAVFAAMATAAPPFGCADHWKVELDSESFAHNGADKTFSAPRLAQFRDKVDAKLKSAVGAACRNGAVVPASAKAIRNVSVRSASGATEPHLYSTSEATLAFEWVFAEERLGLPSAKAIVEGAACWLDPDGPTCAAEGD